jgi:branched-chain amino acid transport system ATP-binding protein
MLEVDNLCVGYAAISALKGISLKVYKGQIVAIIGANGAGKTTLLKTISGLMSQQSGTITFEGQNISHRPADYIVSLGLVQVAEGRQIFAHMSVADNIRLGAYLYYKRRNLPEIRERMDQLHSIFPILAKRSRQIAGTLSGGEQQMLAIARALMTRPKLLLLDEPSMGLAPIVVREILAVVRQLNQMGATILLVEQNARAALNVADYGYVLETGKVVLEGPAKELSRDSRVTTAYLGG